MGRYSLVVISNPVPGKEDEYNNWYNNQHLLDVLKVPGFTAAQRFKMPKESGSPARYMAIYEMDTEDPQSVMAELERRAGTPDLFMSDAIDLNTVSLNLCVPVSEKLKAIRT